MLKIKKKYNFFRKGDELGVFSCTDKKCGWKSLEENILKEYNAVPLHQHACFSTSKCKVNISDGPVESSKNTNNSTSQQNIDEDSFVNEGEILEQVILQVQLYINLLQRVPSEILLRNKKNIIRKVVDALKDSALVNHL